MLVGSSSVTSIETVLEDEATLWLRRTEVVLATGLRIIVAVPAEDRVTTCAIYLPLSSLVVIKFAGRIGASDDNGRNLPSHYSRGVNYKREEVIDHHLP